MIDKLYRRASQQIIDLIAIRRSRRQFIVNNLITDISDMEEYESKKTNNKQ